jgi:hypothetical protein
LNIFDFYKNSEKHGELRQIFELAAQKHPEGLPASFLEKDLWVTEILRLLYEENMMGDFSVAFKGGTALSKCWQAIDRFSEDIDLSIHWADLAGTEDEDAAWEKSIQSRSQQQKFRKEQTKLLIEWSSNLVDSLNKRFDDYRITGLYAELEQESNGEKININFPRMISDTSGYQLDYVLLEFGGRNRGHPTVEKQINSYLSEVSDFAYIECPQSIVQVYDPAYILWEKLTALHQFSTMDRAPNVNRLSRHWYDVDCILRKQIADPLNTVAAMENVVEMKTQRWAEKGVDYEDVLRKKIEIVPNSGRLAGISSDYDESIRARMFYGIPDSFEEIIERLVVVQNQLNS